MSFNWPTDFPLTNSGNPDLVAFFQLPEAKMQTLVQLLDTTTEGQRKLDALTEYARAAQDNKPAQERAYNELYGITALEEQNRAITYQLNKNREQQAKLKQEFESSVNLHYSSPSYSRN